MSKLSRAKNFNVEDLVDFYEKNPWKPLYPASLVRRFLTELISSNECVFDLYDDSGRVSAAVLLDKITNPANDACLEVLGIRSGASREQVMAELFQLACKMVPKHMAGFQCVVSADAGFSSKFFTDQGFAHFYDATEMIRTNSSATVPITSRTEIVQAVQPDCDELYRVLCESFAQSPDTSIPDYDTWKEKFLAGNNSHLFLWKENGKILGFASLIEDRDLMDMEFRTIGVLAGYRGKGIGRYLLEHGIRKATQLGFKTSHLTVAVKNQNALGLYQRAGFKSVENYICYRRDAGWHPLHV